MCVVANTPASKYSGHRVGVSARGRHRVKAGRRGEGRGGTRKTLRSSDLTKPKNLEKHFHQKRGEDKREGEEVSRNRSQGPSEEEQREEGRE
jgi:hypothetical protein